MKFSNSSLVSHIRLSPHHSGQRVCPIDRITPHCVVGHATVEGLGELFANPARLASSNYGIDDQGRVGLYVEEKNRSWCSSSYENDQRAVTIECASDVADPYAMSETVYNCLIDLCTDICKRYGKKRLVWISDKETALAYTPDSETMQLSVHRWFANKSCPGDWLFARLGDVAEKVTARLATPSTPVVTRRRCLLQHLWLTRRIRTAKLRPHGQPKPSTGRSRTESSSVTEIHTVCTIP